MSATHSDQERAIYGLYNRTLARLQFALKFAYELCDRDRNIAGLMLHFTNWATFRDSGAIVCWVGVETLALCDRDMALKARREGKRVDRSRIQRAQKKLMKHGVILRRSAGGGKGNSAIYEFSLDWLERFAEEADSWAPAAVRAKLRTQGATVSSSAYGSQGATVSGGVSAADPVYGGVNAAVSHRGATVSRPNGSSDASVWPHSATVSGPYGGAAAAVSMQSATVSQPNGGFGAAEYSASATVSDLSTVDEAADSAARQGAIMETASNGGMNATVTQVNMNADQANGSTGAFQTAALKPPENKDLKINTHQSPKQIPFLYPLAGGKPVEVAIRDAQRQSKAVALVESDGRFEKLRTEAAKLIGGDVRTANLAIAVMDERLKKDILRGNWPSPPVFRQALKEALGIVGNRLLPPGEMEPVTPRLSGSPVQPFPADQPESLSASGADRVERIAIQAAQQAADALRGVHGLEEQLAELNGLLRRFMGGGQGVAVA